MTDLIVAVAEFAVRALLVAAFFAGPWAITRLDFLRRRSGLPVRLACYGGTAVIVLAMLVVMLNMS